MCDESFDPLTQVFPCQPSRRIKVYLAYAFVCLQGSRAAHVSSLTVRLGP